jgi:hypothetical protein
VLLAAAFFAAGCNYGVESTQPDYYEIYEVSGSAYERGYQHGEHFENKIRSLYTMLLVNAIYPYLNRDHPDVASVMLRYQDEERYGDGKFAYQMCWKPATNSSNTCRRNTWMKSTASPTARACPSTKF